MNQQFYKQITFTFLLLLLSGASIAQSILYEKTASNVSYSDVLALEFREADELLYYGENEFQFGRLWLPRKSEEPSKLVIFIHGGCWLNDFDMAHTYPLSTALAQAGLAVWSLEYRRIGDTGGGWPGSFEDIQRGIQAISDLERYNIDTDSYLLAGHSAGGHLALLAGTNFPEALAVIGLAAITDIKKYAAGSSSCETATMSFMGAAAGENPFLYSTANPADIGTHQRSTLLHGTADAIVDVSQATLENTETLIVENAGHFDWVHPGTDAVDLLLRVIKDSL